MGRSYQCHTYLHEFSRSDSLRRQLKSGICKQNEGDEQSEETPSENSESQQDDDDDSSRQRRWNPAKSIKNDKITTVGQNNGENVRHFTRHIWCDLWKLFRTKSRDWMEIAEAEKKTFDELKSNYRQALISQYHDLVQMGNISKKTQSTNK